MILLVSQEDHVNIPEGSRQISSPAFLQISTTQLCMNSPVSPYWSSTTPVFLPSQCIILINHCCIAPLQQLPLILNRLESKHSLMFLEEGGQPKEQVRTIKSFLDSSGGLLSQDFITYRPNLIPCGSAVQISILV